MIGVDRNAAVRRRRLDAPYGVTLLELILALALAVIVMAAIAWALQLHLKAFDTRRTDIEQAQLARAVLKLIGDDLRSVVAHNAIDFTEAARLATMEELEFEEGEEGEEEGGEDEEGEEEEPKDLSADLTPSTIPGIYGNQYQLLMDVSRLPRIEDFVATVGASEIPSDVKTITYYLQAEAARPEEDDDSLMTNRRDAGSTAQGWGQGLVRRALDRSVTQWAVENGDTSRLDAQGEVVAPEVVALEFRYFDGQAWLTEWDTQARGGLPQAVEVAVAIRASDDPEARSPTESPPTTLLAAQSPAGVRVYSQIIRIPAAAPPAEVEELEVDEE